MYLCSGNCTWFQALSLTSSALPILILEQCRSTQHYQMKNNNTVFIIELKSRIFESKSISQLQHKTQGHRKTVPKPPNLLPSLWSTWWPCILLFLFEALFNAMLISKNFKLSDTNIFKIFLSIFLLILIFSQNFYQYFVDIDILTISVDILSIFRQPISIFHQKA